MSFETILRWIARVWSVASFLLILAFAFGGREPGWPTLPQAVGLFFFPIMLIVGFGMAWRREVLGGLISVTGLALFYAWMFARSGQWPTGPYFLLFAAPGFLFLGCAFLGQLQQRFLSGRKNA